MRKLLKKIRLIIFNKKYNTNIKSVRASLSAKYGKNVRVGSNSYIENDVIIGDYSYINENSYIENCIIGKYTSISSGVYISPFEHNTKYITTHPILYNKVYNLVNENEIFERPKVIIGNDVLISLNVVILKGVKIGNGAVIGAGSIVTRDVKPYEVVAGVPAKHIRYRFEENEIKNLEKQSWWNWNEDKIKKNVQYLKKNTTKVID